MSYKDDYYYIPIPNKECYDITMNTLVSIGYKHIYTSWKIMEQRYRTNVVLIYPKDMTEKIMYGSVEWAITHEIIRKDVYYNLIPEELFIL